MVVRVATWNIHHGAPPRARRPDLGRTAAELAGLRADVVGLQEVDRLARRTGGVDQAAVLARAMGADHHFARARSLLGGGDYGNAVLVRGEVRSASDVVLPTAGEPRVAVVAEVAVTGQGAAGATLTVAVTHLQHRGGAPRREAPAQLAHLLDLLGGRPGPVVILGDLNLEEGEVLGPLAGAGFVAAPTGPTFPAGAPARRLDWVAVRGLHVQDAEVVAATASDHLPVVAGVRPATGG